MSPLASSAGTYTHTPVLLQEVVELAAVQPGDTICDVTLGLGGHAQALLAAAGPKGSLIGIDADEQNLHQAQKRLKDTPGSKQYIHTNFLHLQEADISPVDVLLADLGLSSPHVDDASRGFTFREDQPLDLRYDRSSGISAAEFIESVSEDELRQVFHKYAEVREAPKLARIIAEQKPTTTGQLRECCEKVFYYKTPQKLPQVFQALRIEVNHELDALSQLLSHGPQLLNSGGRFLVISYHSLEDRLVKRAFRTLCLDEKNEQTGAVAKQAPFEDLTRKPITPSDQEMHQNPRSRSAKLRAVCKR